MKKQLKGIKSGFQKYGHRSHVAGTKRSKRLMQLAGKEREFKRWEQGHRFAMEGFGFDKKKTDMPWYDNMLKNPKYYREAKGVKGKIQMMTPDEYIKKVAGIQKTSAAEQQRMFFQPKVDRILEHWKKGAKMPMPVLDYAKMTQEGRHRAWAAKRLNIKKIPVLVVDEV